MADQLAAATHELETLAYAISHDLRTPLRAIDGFSRALLVEHAGQLNDEGRRYLERIRAGTQRMAQLIEDLLGLSRISRAPVTRERVDLSALARQVLADLSGRAPDRVVEAVVTDGLVAHADPRLSVTLFECLLENAWKFSARTPRARIEVTREATADGEPPAFLVRDNGAGFDMNHATKLFQPFQRLHAASDFPGAGIGLATAQRVVICHGGRIWARAAPDQGATFYFTLGERA